jgi:hypothetical protein
MKGEEVAAEIPNSFDFHTVGLWDGLPGAGLFPGQLTGRFGPIREQRRAIGYMGSQSIDPSAICNLLWKAEPALVAKPCRTTGMRRLPPGGYEFFNALGAPRARSRWNSVDVAIESEPPSRACHDIAES